MKSRKLWSLSGKMKKVIFWVLGVLVVGGTVFYYKRKAPTVLDQSQGDQALPVEVSPVERGPIARRTTLNGEIKSPQSVSLVLPIQGIISKILCKDGERVAKGALLVSLDDSQAKAELQEAQARLEDAKGAYQRAKAISDKGFGSPAETNSAKAAYAVAQAQVEKAKFYLKQTKLYAPFEGYVGISNISEGAYVTPNQELSTLVNLDNLYVDFSVPESSYSNIVLEDTVDVVVPSVDLLPYQAKIIAIDPKVDGMNRSVSVRASLGNEEKTFRPGMFAKVSILLGQEEDALLVPENAIKAGEDNVVFVVSDGYAIERPVTLGLKEEGKVQIIEGVSEGELVIVDGLARVGNGTPVKVVNA